MKSTVSSCSIFFLMLILSGCTTPLVEVSPREITDTSTVTITCNGAKGNKGLMNFEEPVYVHLGLITDSSINPNHWRYVKFKWGSTDEAALVKRAGRNQWTYEIPNIRKFFGVAENERIQNIAILFRQGNCIDTLCKTLRNEDKSDIFIPVRQSE
jgi:hypothetical protein